MRRPRQLRRHTAATSVGVRSMRHLQSACSSDVGVTRLDELLPVDRAELQCDRNPGGKIISIRDKNNNKNNRKGGDIIN